MTLTAAVKAGQLRVRQEKWANKDDYLLLANIGTPEKPMMGPWVRLYSPVQHLMCMKIGSQTILSFQITDDDFVPYEGESSPYEPGEQPEHIHDEWCGVGRGA